jgi:hypothetical protein
MLTLLPVLIAVVAGPAPPPPFSLVPWDLATLTDRGARQLAGRRRGQTAGDLTTSTARAKGARVCDPLPW